MASIYQKIDLFKALVTGNPAYADPVFVTLDITRRCNFSCLACSYHSPEVYARNPVMSDMPVEMARSIAEQLRPSHTRSVVIEGSGEPFCHPDVLEIVRIYKELGFRVTILTNGSLLDEKMIRRLIDLKTDIMKVSLWAGTEKAFIQHYPGVPSRYFKTILKNMLLISRLKKQTGAKRPSVWIHHPLSKHNFNAIPEMVELAYRHHCDGITFAPLIYYEGISTAHYPSQSDNHAIRQTLRSIRGMLRARGLHSNLDQILLRLRIGPHIWEKVPCYFVWTHARIRGDGLIYPCCRCDIPLGNVKDHSFDVVWTGETYQRLRMKVITKQGLESFQSECDCRYCFHVQDSVRIHRFIAPLIRKKDV